MPAQVQIESAQREYLLQAQFARAGGKIVRRQAAGKSSQGQEKALLMRAAKKDEQKRQEGVPPHWKENPACYVRADGTGASA